MKLCFVKCASLFVFSAASLAVMGGCGKKAEKPKERPPALVVTAVPILPALQYVPGFQ